MRQLDIEILQGDTWTLSLVWKYADGTPVDLTGASARMQMRRYYTSPTPFADLSTVDDSIVLGGATGGIQVKMSALASAAIEAGTGVHDLEVSFPNDVVRKAIRGSVTILPEVTK